MTVVSTLSGVFVAAINSFTDHCWFHCKGIITID